jgi:hypothetical protein
MSTPKVTQAKVIVLCGTTAVSQYPYLAAERAKLDLPSQRRVVILATDSLNPRWYGAPDVEALQLAVPTAIAWVLDGRIPEHALQHALMPPFPPKSGPDGTDGIRNSGLVGAANGITKLSRTVARSFTRALGLPEDGDESAAAGLSLSVLLIAFEGGGTAPGQTIPLLLTIREVAAEMQIDLNVEAHLILPGNMAGVSNDVLERRQANAYSLLLELVAVRKAVAKGEGIDLPMGDGVHHWKGNLVDQVFLYKDKGKAGTIPDPLRLPCIVAREVMLRVQDASGVGREIRQDRVRLDTLREFDDWERPTMFSIAGSSVITFQAAEIAEALAALATIDSARLMSQDPSRGQDSAGPDIWDRFAGQPPADWVNRQMELLTDVVLQEISAQEILIGGAAVHEATRRNAVDRAKDDVQRKAGALGKRLEAHLNETLLAQFFAGSMPDIERALQDCSEKLEEAGRLTSPVPSDAESALAIALKAFTRSREEEREYAADAVAVAARDRLQTQVNEQAANALRQIIAGLARNLADCQQKARVFKTSLIDLSRASGKLEMEAARVPMRRGRAENGSPLERPLLQGDDLVRLYEALTPSWPFERREGRVVALADDVPSMLVAWVRQHHDGALPTARAFSEAVRAGWARYFMERLASLSVEEIARLGHGDLEALARKIRWMSHVGHPLMTALDLGSVEDKVTRQNLFQAPKDVQALAEEALDGDYQISPDGTQEAIVLSRSAHGFALEDFPELAPGSSAYKAYKKRQQAWLRNRTVPVHACLQLEGLVLKEIFDGSWDNLK